jgi:hypothetical protein
MARLGWTEACHHAALEILGYRFNRVPMLKIAARAPLADWVGGAVDVASLFAAEGASWTLQGVRPANHPRVRLGQYASWTGTMPDWPKRLEGLGNEFNTQPIPSGLPTSIVRRRHGLPELRAHLATEIVAEAVGGTRLDNLVCDGFLPLLATKIERELFPLWFHWFVGDLSPRLHLVLKSLAVFDGHAQPACHGLAQGLLGWMLARESGKEDPISAVTAHRPPAEEEGSRSSRSGLRARVQVSRLRIITESSAHITIEASLAAPATATARCRVQACVVFMRTHSSTK